MGTENTAISELEVGGESEDLDEVIRRNPEDVTAYICRGIVSFYKDAYDQALLDFGEAIRLCPKSALAYYNRAIAYYTRQDYDSAISDYDEAIKIFPADPIPYYNRGVTHYDNHDLDLALQDYNEAIRLHPKNTIIYDSEGFYGKIISFRTSRKEKLTEEVTKIIRKAISQHSEDHNAHRCRISAHHCYKGITCVYKKNEVGAVENFQVALMLHPKDIAVCDATLARKPVSQILRILSRLRDEGVAIDKCLTWLFSYKLPGFGKKTPAELISEGKEEYVHAHLDRIMEGGYA